MAINKDQKKLPAITPLTRPSSLISSDKRWNSVLKAVKKSFTSGLSADFSVIYWQNQNSSEFKALSVIGTSKRAVGGALKNKLIPVKWTKKMGLKRYYPLPEEFQPPNRV